MESLINVVISNLAPWAIFVLVAVKLYLDYLGKKKERIGGKDPKDLTREMISQIHSWHFDKDVTGNLLPRSQPCQCRHELKEIKELIAEVKNAT
jgi:hypothetical protein